MKVLRKESGFTLIEVIVVAGIIAVLAGILVPIIFKEIDESKKTRAAADVKSISSALFVLKKDTGQWPVSTNCVPAVTMLTGKGTVPTFAGAGWVDANQGRYTHSLAADDNGCWSPPAVDPATWKGPYMAEVTADPWGRAYVTNAAEFLTAGPVWIISAGPDGIVQTDITDSVPRNDDIGIRLN
jgi:general secretion pathway protein G